MPTSQPWQPSSDLTEALADAYPALAAHCPILDEISLPQAVFLLDDGRESLYGGAVGGGKSAALLMAALMYVDVPGYAALILRRNFPQLTQPGMLIPLSKQWIGNQAAWNEQQKQWLFPSGAVLKFGHVEDESAALNYQGGAYHFVGFDELTQFSENAYTYIAFSRQRRTRSMADIGVPIRVRATANPGGIGHAWVWKRFIEKPDPARLFVPAKVADNPAWVPGEYEESLSHLPDMLRRQLLDGDWGAFEGMAFTVTDDHLVDDFPLTNAHSRFEAADYGLNGTPWALIPIDHDGNLVFYDMLYEKNQLPSDVAELVLAKRKAGWGDGHDAYCDPSIWHRTGGRNRWGQPATLASEFDDHGVPLLRANNDPRAGLIRLRELLAPDAGRAFPEWHPRRGEPGAPRVFFVRDRCQLLLEELRSAPLQAVDKQDGGEKVDPDWESRYGHACAMARYAVMTRPAPSVRPPAPEGDPRAELMRLSEQRLMEGRADGGRYSAV